MAKRKKHWTEEKIKKYQKEGRGQGEYSEYMPWLKIQDVPSNGNSTRIKGWKTNRQHEFFSNLERDYFFLLDWSEDVQDIRELFPLDREITLSISEQKNIPHPMDPTTKTPIVMTTDFLITLKDKNKLVTLARTIKPSEVLDNKRVIEKFEIEREYWVRQNVNWGIVTEKEIPNNYVKNIQWLHKFYFLDDKMEYLFSQQFLKLLITNAKNEQRIIELCNEFDEFYQLDTGSGIIYLKYLLARKLVSIDMQKKINIRGLKINDIKVNFSLVGENVDNIIG